MFENKNYELLLGNSLDKLKELPDCSVQTCITSPPYYALRDYGTGHWEGGDPNCPHYRTSKYSANDKTGHKAMGDAGQAVGDAIYKTICPLCGAVRVDEQIGLEETPDEYIEKLVQVFREVKRVLRDDGTLWINIGDSYATNSPANHNFEYSHGSKANNKSICKTKVISEESGIKQKDLIGIPWKLAFALRADGWYLRQDIIWHKPNPMPESVKDRCTKSHEYIFLLSKEPDYYFDNDAIKEDAVTHENRLPGITRNRVFEYNSKINNNPESYLLHDNKPHSSDIKYIDMQKSGELQEYLSKRNKRDVWTVDVSTYKGAHFATYPEELITPCILAGSREGDIVLDVFNGSGTTGAVAMKYGRKYIGIDLNQDYLDITVDRFNTLEGISKVEDSEGNSVYYKQESLF